MVPSFAAFVLFAWPPLAVTLLRRLPTGQAIAVALVAGYLILPTRPSYNLPLLPPYDREVVTILPALLLIYFKWSASKKRARPREPGVEEAQPLGGWIPRHPFTRLCVFVLICAPFLTVLTNSDPLYNGSRWLSKLTLYDAFSQAMLGLIAILPFLMARKYLASSRNHQMLLWVFCIAGLVYSLPTLYEIRMSPQLNNMIYGYFPHDWRQHIRGDGFRPVVFLKHGLRLAIFLSACLLATLGALKIEKGPQRGRLWLAAAWLFMTLVLAKSFGALAITMLIAPVILLATTRWQLIAAATLALVVLFYPMSRSTGLFPVQTVLNTVSSVAPEERMRSLNFRIRNEALVLEHSNRKPFFGWGGYGRNLVWSERGSASTMDGTWIIVFSRDGWVGYLSTFGLLTVPIVLLAFRQRKPETATAVLGLMLAGNLTDLIPNSSLTPITWLMAGAVAGRLELARDKAPETEAERTEPAPSPRSAQSPRYRRDLSASSDKPARGSASDDTRMSRPIVFHNSGANRSSRRRAK